MPTFDLHQQSFALSLAVNAAYTIQGTPAELEQRLQAHITKNLADPAMQGLIGNWSLVWGPAVWNNLPVLKGPSANTAAVFHNADSGTYVCAIAATNANSIFDWVVEDFWVSDKVRWEYTDADALAYLSAGTNFGIGALLSLRDPNTGAFLADALAGAATPDSTLIFTGHSLAGALSPTLAMVLYGTPQKRAPWKQVLVYPTAGATPGNLGFANAFAKQFPARSTGAGQWQKWNQVLWNELDVVPHAWGVSTMDQLPFMYDATFGMRLELGSLALAGLYLAGVRPANILDPYANYTALPNCKLTGVPQQNVPIDGFGKFTAEMGYQHVDAYYDLLGVPQLKAFGPIPADNLLTAAQPSAAAYQQALARAQEVESLALDSGLKKAVVEAATG